MYAHGQEVVTVARRIALVCTLWLVPLALEWAPASGAEYRFEGTVSYVSDGSNNEVDLTGEFQINERLVFSCRIDPSLVPASPSNSVCMNCVTELAFSVGDYAGTMQPGSISVLHLYDNAAESDTVCGGQDPEVDEFFVMATGIIAPDVAGVPIAYAGFRFVDCEAEAWTSANLPNTKQPLVMFENRHLTLVFWDGSRIGFVYATVTDAVVPVAQVSWGKVKARYR